MKFCHIMDGPPLYTNCFLLIGSGGHAAAIDPAADAARFVAELETAGAVLTHILLTHGHHDHVGSVQPLREKYGAKLCMSEADAKAYHMAPDIVFTDMGTLTVDDMTFTTIATPGHTPGSVCIRMNEWLFTGDTLFAQDIGRTDFPGGSMADMRQSLKKLLAAVADDPQVLPGHEEFSTMAYERVHNPYLRLT